MSSSSKGGAGGRGGNGGNGGSGSADERRVRVGRPRSNSAPARYRNTPFYLTLRSVLTHGLQPRANMAPGQYEGGHDTDNTGVHVTRVRDTGSSATNAANSRRASVTRHHGSLPITMERGGEEPQSQLESEAQLRQRMNPNQRAIIDAHPDMANSLRERVLTPAGRQESERRMQASFLTTTRAEQPARTDFPVMEANRGAVAPNTFTGIAVPEGQVHAANQVRREMGRRHDNLPPITPVGNTTELAPDYFTRGGEQLTTTGQPNLTAPAYDTFLRQELQRHGDLDVHVVRTPVAGVEAPAAGPRARTRARANSAPPSLSSPPRNQAGGARGSPNSSGRGKK